MEVDLPFQRRNVVEWSHRDQLTGALERARRETNHWSASTASAVHNYGKVVDHRAVNLADGRVQQTQRKQLEVFSTVVPGGSLQVFRSSTTSSSRSTITQMGTGWPSVPDVDAAFGDLQLALHPLDLSSEKTKASVGRSIGWRRPPTRVARVAAAQQKDAETTDTISNEDDRQPIISFPSDDDSTEKSTSIISSSSQRNSSRHSIIESRKSCSSENLVKVGADNEAGAAEESSAGLWGRSSLLRRSLQYTRPPDFPTGTSVKKMREEIEARGVPIIASHDIQLTPTQSHTKELPLDRVKRIVNGSLATQNHSFVTVKSLNEVRGRLRSKQATEDVPTEEKHIEKGEDSADVIVSEDHVLRRVKDTSAPSTPRVQSYVFGMDARVTSPSEQEKPSKPIMLNGFKSEEWFRRRKSYGFELDLPQSEEIILPKESKEDSLSDNGSTYRSSVFLPVSPFLKHLDGLKSTKEIGSGKVRPSLYESTKSENRSQGKEDKIEIIELSPPRVDVDIQQKSTVVNLVNKNSERTVDMERRRDMLRRKTEREIMKQGNTTRRLTDPVSVSIPVVSNDSYTIRSEDQSEETFVEPTLLINGFHLSDEERRNSVDVPEKKRHSIAVVESGHIDEDDVKVNQMERLSQSDHIVPASPSDPTEDPNQSRKKRVEFSKTEVHFAAEPGRFNLVSTDDKPPPTNIVRGRRRQKLLAEQRINRSGLPQMRFGDPPPEQKILTRNAAISESANESNITSGAIINVTIEGRLSPVVQHAEERPQPQVTLTPLDNEGEGENPRGVVRCTLNGEQGSVNQSSVPMWRSTVTLRNNAFASPPVILNQEKSSGEAEFQRLLKSLRPTGKRNIHPELVAEVNVTSSEPQIIRSKGFSTKINVGPPSRPEEIGENHGISVASVAPPPHSHDLPEHKSALNNIKLSRLGLESTPLVRLANRRRRPMSSEDEELSDDSLQADAEVRAYMVEKSSLINLGGGSRGSVVSPILEDHRYKHHASKAERLVQTDSGEQRACSPSSVYIVPDKNGFTKVHDFRSPTSVHLPLSSTLVDRVSKRVDAATQVLAEPSDYERTTSVRDILTRLSAENKSRGSNDPPRERIIEIISASSDDGSFTPSMTWNKSQDLGLVNGASRGALGSGLFAESKVSKDILQNESRETASKFSSPTIGVHKHSRISRFAHAAENSELQADRDSFSNKMPAHLSEETQRNKLNRRSPSAPREDFTPIRSSEGVNGKELRVSAASSCYHIDAVERFLKSERSHHDERRRRSDRRDPSRDRRRGEHSWERRENLEVRRERDRHNRELGKRELTPTNGGENHPEEMKRRSHKTDLNFDASDRREGGEDVGRKSYDRRDHREERHRSRSRGEHRDRSRDPRSRSRDDRMDVRGELDLKHRTGERRSRSRDELQDPRRESEFEDHTRKRSRSRDELKHGSLDSRSRSTSKDKLEHESRELRSTSRSRDEQKHESRLLQSRRPSRDEQEPLHLSRERRSRSRDELERRDYSREARRSRSRDELQRTDRAQKEAASPVALQDENNSPVDVTITGLEGTRKSHRENEERRHREVERKPSDQKREMVGQGGRDRLSEPLDRRSRCKCSERADSRNSELRTETSSRLGDRGNNAQVSDKSNRIHPVSRSNRNHIQDSTQSSRRAKASSTDKTDKVVRKTRVHVAAMESPIAHLVKSTKERRLTDTKKAGDVQIIIEPLRPVRRSGVPKPSFPETNVKGSKMPLQKRTSGNSSDVNSNLSQKKSAASPLPQQIPPTDLTQKRPARRHNRKNPSES